MDNKYNTNYSSGLVRLDDALKLSRNTSRDVFVRVLLNIRVAQGNLSVLRARELNKRNPLFRLPINALHVLLHHVKACETFILFRQTSSLLRQLIDQAGLAAFNRDAGAPLCRRPECAESLIASVGLHQTPQLYDEMQRRLPLAVQVTLNLTSGPTTNSLVDLRLGRWKRTCAALGQPAPHLRDLVICDMGSVPNWESMSVIPADIFANSAPALRSATIHRISLPIQIEKSSFAGLASLTYTPPRLSLLVEELAHLVIGLSQLKTLALRLLSIDSGELYPVPINHHLQALRIEGMRRGFSEVYHMLYKESTTLCHFEARHRIRDWRHYLSMPPEQLHDLAIGLNITELNIAPTDPGRGSHRLRFYHRGEPESLSFIGPNAQWLTKFTLHHLMWPEREPLPEAPCLTEIHIIMTKCNAAVATMYGMPVLELQSIFLATKQTAWRVPALRHFSLSYVLSKPADACERKHHSCCRKGRMLISAELLAKTVSELFIFEQEQLDDIRLNCIELYEPRPLALAMLMALARDVVQTSQTVDSPAAMHTPSPLPPLKV